MHRAAVRAFRTTYQCTVRSLSRINRRRSFSSHNPVLAALTRSLRYPSREHVLAQEPLKSSMYIRRFSVALVSGLVGYGAYYTYQTTGNSTSQVARSFTTQTGEDAVPTRAVLVVGADELHTGTFVGEGPISKTTSDDVRKVLEMLTPDQATQKLRKSEQSYLVNRGQGVVRYDLVQLPSNDPIEDDHAEKIIAVPGQPGQTDNANHDWMFWGLFDGHS